MRMVLDLQRTDPQDKNVISRVARQLGVGSESLRTWVKQAQIDAGNRPGLTTEEQAELTKLRKENRELHRANDILQAAASFFGACTSPEATRVGSISTSSRRLHSP